MYEHGQKNFALLVEDEKYLSNTYNNQKYKEISVGDLNKQLGERGFVISNRYGDLKDKPLEFPTWVIIH